MTGKLYPQAAADGSPIPDAIGRIKGYVVGELTSATPKQYTLPDTDNICSVYVTEACVITESPTAVHIGEQYQPKGYVLLPGIMYNIFITTSFFRIQKIGTGSTAQFFLNLLEPWSGAGQDVERRF